ncbi:slipin family protein [Altericista sp. CCNU0014]|uniref:slipin family protein n=1 Tax=Altericista sp. CCNU0014 TaxID=3082949 RepID=UPI00384EA1DE
MTSLPHCGRGRGCRTVYFRAAFSPGATFGLCGEGNGSVNLMRDGRSPALQAASTSSSGAINLENKMFKTFYIKPNERGILYRRSDFKTILHPGTHYLRWGRWTLQTFDLNQPEAKIENLELLLQTHPTAINAHLEVVKTQFNEAALVRLGQRWLAVGPNQLRAFWRGFIEVETHLFNLEESLELLPVFVKQLRNAKVEGIDIIQVSESEMGLLYEQGNFVRPLEPGDYGFWTFGRKVSVRTFDRTQPAPNFPLEEVLIECHSEFVAAYCETVQLGVREVAVVRHRGKAIAVLPPCSRKLFWKGVEIEAIDISTDSKLPARLVAELVSGLADVLQMSHESLHMQEVKAQHIGLLYVDGAFASTLPAGLHVWWVFGRSIQTESVDLRLQTLEVSGQEILTKDKVPLRLNLTAGYRITDPVRAKTELSDIDNFVYKELQFALRGAVGTRGLDALLEDKGTIDTSVAEYIRQKTADYGIEIESVGVKDIILPGEIKAILSKVVEAEKAAQANVIRRREETAATRSMLNTAKVMEDNPIALRLKELEILERIAEKIEHININGGLDSILTEVIRIAQR